LYAKKQKIHLFEKMLWLHSDMQQRYFFGFSAKVSVTGLRTAKANAMTRGNFSHNLLTDCCIDQGFPISCACTLVGTFAYLKECI